MNNKILTVLKFTLGWPLSILALFFVGKILFPNASHLIMAIPKINFYLFMIGIVCFLIYYFLRCLFWKLLIQFNHYSLSFKETSYAWSLSEIRRYIPGNIWSFLSRTQLFSAKGVSKKLIFYSLVLESEYLIIGSFLLSMLAYSYLAKTYLKGIFLNYFLTSVISIIILMILTLFIFPTYFVQRKLLPKIAQHLLPRFSLLENVYLLCFSALFSLFFALGTYFSIHSLFFLNPSHFSTFIGIFIFSFFVGYVSVITPMGLGIREGIIIIGLTPFIGVTDSGFAALFARIVLIFCELLYLFTTYLWVHIREHSLWKFEHWLKNRWQLVVLTFLLLSYSIYFTAASFYRYVNFYTGRFDLGNMDQTVWNTLHGHIFQLTNPDGTNIISRLSFHADFILILLAPFYLIWQDPRTLLLIQTIIIAIGAYYLYAITQSILKSKTLALMIAFMYLLNPSIQDANLYDFHAVTLATTFLLAAYYYLHKRSYYPCMIFLFLAAITKEQVWVVTALFGILMMFFPRTTTHINFVTKQRVLGSITTVTSILLFIVIFFYAIPRAHGGGHFALQFYSDFGSSPSSIIKGIIFSPAKTLSTAFAPDRLEYLKELLVPFGFLPLLAPLFLLFTIPDLTINLLSSNPAFHQIYYQYTAIITPFLFLSMIYAIKRIHQWIPKVPYAAICFYLLIATAISCYLWGSLPGDRYPNLDMFNKPLSYRTIVENFLSDIPQKYSIAATNNLGSHLSHRQKIFTVPVGIDQADLVLFLLNDRFAAPSLQAQISMANNMKHDKKYIEIFKTGDFIVFEKRNLYVHTEPNIDKVKLFPLSIPTLQTRDFIGGEVKIVQKIADKKEFISYLVSYPSDGLHLFALLDIPTSRVPKNGFPVIILNHGYVVPKDYSTETSYQYVSDYFAAHGFLVLKPDYRGNAKSEKDTNISNLLSYPIDVLNLISSVSTIKQADYQNIFLWGHSIGGAVTLTTLEVNNVNPDFPIKIKGAVVWAPVIDPYRAYEEFKFLYSFGKIPYYKAFRMIGSLNNNPFIWQSVSPLFYLNNLTTPIQIMHGTNDSVIPYQWSIELYDDLISLNKKAQLQIYPNDDHVLTNSRNDALRKNVVFFKQILKNTNLH